MRILFCALVFILCVSLLIGCSKENENIVDLKNTQKVEIVTVDEPESILNTLEHREEIDDFVQKLKVDSWSYDSIPADAIECNMFKIYQPETVKLDGDQLERKAQLVAIITIFQEGPYIKFETKHSTINFKAPVDVIEYLYSLIEG